MLGISKQVSLSNYNSTGKYWKENLLRTLPPGVFQNLGNPKSYAMHKQRIFFQNSIAKRPAATMNKRISYQKISIDYRLKSFGLRISFQTLKSVSFRMSGGPFSNYHLQDTEGSRINFVSRKFPQHEQLPEMQGCDSWTSWPMRSMKTKNHPKAALYQHWIKLTSCENISLCQNFIYNNMTCFMP